MLLVAFLQERIEELIIKKVHLLFVDCLRQLYLKLKWSSKVIVVINMY